MPTMIESGVPDFRAVVWQGFSAPAGTPQPIVDRLNAAARQALQAPEVMGRFKELGAQPIGSTPEEFDALTRRELTVWADVVRRSGVKAN
jgi:tripartite-type tricarboxylate transporter receptor subunit TctC